MVEIDTNICEELKEKQRNQYEKELKDILSLKEGKGTAAAVFGLKKKMLGQKAGFDEPSVIKDPKTNQIVTKPSMIKEVCVNYCQGNFFFKSVKLHWVDRICVIKCVIDQNRHTYVL